jgi:Chlorophyll A-B binding protein
LKLFYILWNAAVIMFDAALPCGCRLLSLVLYVTMLCSLQSEIKHGRVAMLASVGYLVQEQFHPFFTQNPQADIGPALIHFQVCTAVQ